MTSHAELIREALKRGPEFLVHDALAAVAVWEEETRRHEQEIAALERRIRMGPPSGVRGLGAQDRGELRDIADARASSDATKRVAELIYKALDALESTDSKGECVCGEINMRHSPIHSEAAEAESVRLTEGFAALRKIAAEAVEDERAEVVRLAGRVETLEEALRGIAEPMAGLEPATSWAIVASRRLALARRALAAASEPGDAMKVATDHSAAAASEEANEPETDPLAGLPPELARVLRDQSVVIQQDQRVWELIASWANAKSDTPSSLASPPGEPPPSKQDLREVIRHAVDPDAGWTSLRVEDLQAYLRVEGLGEAR